MNKRYFRLGVSAVLIVSALIAVLYVSLYVFRSIAPYQEPCLCSAEHLVDFSGLKPLNTSLSKDDLLEIYRLVLLGEDSCRDKFFLSPFAPLIDPWITPLPRGNNNETLPEELPDLLSCDYKFAYIEDVFDGQRVACDRTYIILSKPNVLSNGTVLIRKESMLPEVLTLGREFHLIKTFEGNWTIITSESTFIAHRE